MFLIQFSSFFPFLIFVFPFQFPLRPPPPPSPQPQYLDNINPCKCNEWTNSSCCFVKPLVVTLKIILILLKYGQILTKNKNFMGHKIVIYIERENAYRQKNKKKTHTKKEKQADRQKESQKSLIKICVSFHIFYAEVKMYIKIFEYEKTTVNAKAIRKCSKSRY